MALAGLCAYLGGSEAPRPVSTHADAVRLLTYHGAKGREWPLVVLTDFDKRANGHLFGLSASPEGIAAQAAACREALRLLYVGATCARDYLVLVDGGRGLAWLDELSDADGRPHVRLEEDRVEVGEVAFPARGLELGDEAELPAALEVIAYAAPAGGGGGGPGRVVTTADPPCGRAQP